MGQVNAVLAADSFQQDPFLAIQARILVYQVKSKNLRLSSQPTKSLAFDPFTINTESCVSLYSSSFPKIGCSSQADRARSHPAEVTIPA